MCGQGDVGVVFVGEGRDESVELLVEVVVALLLVLVKEDGGARMTPGGG